MLPPSRTQTRTELQVTSAQAHPKSARAIVLFFLPFFGCFGYPLVNFTRIMEGRMTISITPFLLLWVCYELGIWAAAISPRRPARQVWLGMMGLHLAGMGGRLLMEWGEVSISTDFTLPNLFIHLGTLGAIFLWGIREARKVS